MARLGHQQMGTRMMPRRSMAYDEGAQGRWWGSGNLKRGGGRLELFKFGMYLSIPVFASFMYGFPEHINSIVRKVCHEGPASRGTRVRFRHSRVRCRRTMVSTRPAHQHADDGSIGRGHATSPALDYRLRTSALNPACTRLPMMMIPLALYMPLSLPLTPACARLQRRLADAIHHLPGRGTSPACRGRVGGAAEERQVEKKGGKGCNR